MRLDLPHFALVGSGTATVVATDAMGSPLLTLNQYGQGKAVFLAAPLERAIAQSDPWAAPDAVRALLRTVYGSVARAAGAGPVIDCDEPVAEIALFSGEAGDVVLVLNHSAEPVTATLDRRACGSLGDGYTRRRGRRGGGAGLRRTARPERGRCATSVVRVGKRGPDDREP